MLLKGKRQRETSTCAISASRTRSEDRFAGSSLSLLNPTAETSTPIQQPSYAAHTSSSMSKLRDNTVPTTPTRRTPSVVSSDTRPSSANKHMTKSLSSQNLIPPLSGIIQVTSFGSSLPRTKLPRRPPNLPIASTTSSSSSTSTSPTKTRPKGDDDDDQMPKWAQDCFYRTVVLGLKPVLLEDLPSSPTPPPMKPSTSTCSIDSSDLSEITNEIQSYSLAQVRRSVSIPDYQQVQPFKQKITIESSTTTNDQRLPIVNQLADSLNKHLEELEHFYSTVICSLVWFSSDGFLSFRFLKVQIDMIACSNNTSKRSLPIFLHVWPHINNSSNNKKTALLWLWSIDRQCASGSAEDLRFLLLFSRDSLLLFKER